jgi:hypothetical protein
VKSAAAIVAAALLALAARVPGIFWGDDFPGGFRGHHVDEWTHVVNAEVMIDPKSPPRWRPNPYPKGLAAHVAVPILAQQKLAGREFGAAAPASDRVVPPDRTLILFGRAWSVAYGVATVVVLWLLARRLTGSESIARLAAFFLALGGLHVSQSHFFVADVPALFWTLLATHLMLVDLDERGGRALALPMAAFSLGVAAGLKLSVLLLPSLLILALLFPSRVLRVAQCVAFLVAGFAIVTFGSYGPVDLQKTLDAGITSGIGYPLEDLVRIYGFELLASIGIPVAVLATLGMGTALRGAVSRAGAARLLPVLLLILLPCAFHVFAMLRSLDPFPRHLLAFFPWLAILAAAALDALATRLADRRAVVFALFAVVFGWQAALVFDGERNYLTEPRNLAMRWLEAPPNAPRSASVTWPAYETEVAARGFDATKLLEKDRPDVVVAELYFWNHFLSGSGPRESYPTDWRRVFDGRSAARVAAFQDAWRGASGYKPVARFSEGYVMPELSLADRILGNRSRNYLTEVVILRRD